MEKNVGRQWRFLLPYVYYPFLDKASLFLIITFRFSFSFLDSVFGRITAFEVADYQSYGRLSRSFSQSRTCPV